MKMRNGHIAIASITSAILCPLPYILLLDEYSRESEFAPQILGFAFASIAVFVYCAVFFSVFLFFILFQKSKPLSYKKRDENRFLVLFGLISCVLYFAIGLVSFHGMCLENTVFYLVSRFAPYFFSILFCLMTHVFINVNNQILFGNIASCLAPVLVIIEKLAIGKISSIDILFVFLYLVIYAIFVGIHIKNLEKNKE